MGEDGLCVGDSGDDEADEFDEEDEVEVEGCGFDSESSTSIDTMVHNNACQAYGVSAGVSMAACMCVYG